MFFNQVNKLYVFVLLFYNNVILMELYYFTKKLVSDHNFSLINSIHKSFLSVS